METYKTISFALLTTWAACAIADDAVGLVRVDAGTNGVVETEMPFSPIGDSGPIGYVSGAFLGDGGEFSDQLFRTQRGPQVRGSTRLRGFPPSCRRSPATP